MICACINTLSFFFFFWFVILFFVCFQIPVEAFRRPGPTRIPKPKGFSSLKGANSSAANLGQQNKSQSLQPLVPPGRELASSHNNNNNPNLMNRRLWHHCRDSDKPSSSWTQALHKFVFVLWWTSYPDVGALRVVICSCFIVLSSVCTHFRK